MRICLINSLFEPYILGGAEVYLRALVEALAPEHEIFVITTRPYAGWSSFRPQPEQVRGATLYRFYPFNVFHLYQRPRSRLLKAVWYLLDLYNPHVRGAVRQALDTIRPDVVHTHVLRGLSLSVWDAIRDLHLPHVHTLHDYYLLCHYSTLMHAASLTLCDGRHGPCRLHRPLLRRLADIEPGPALVLSPSRYVLDQHTRLGLFAHTRQGVLPHWAPASLPGAELVPQPGPLRVLFMGSISQHKGVRYLVQAFRRVTDRQARLEVVGGGTAELALCQNLAQGDPRITFPGFLSGTAKEEAFTRANVVVVPSIFPDNLPVTILEAQVRAKGVVASRIGGIPELITHGTSGWLVESANIDQLAAALQRLSDDPPFREQLGRQARAAALHFTAPTHVGQLVQGYATVAMRAAAIS